MPPELKNYIDATVSELINLIKPVDIDLTKEENKPRLNLTGTNTHIDITKEIVGSNIHTMMNYDGSIYGLIIQDGDKACGLEDEAYLEFQKLINQIYKYYKRKINVSYDFIRIFVSDWIFNTYNGCKAIGIFSQHLENSINDSVREYQVYIPILYLDIAVDFKIGKVQIVRLNKEYLDKLETEFNENNPRQPNEFISIKEQLLNHVYAVIGVTAEARMAMELAFKECALAFDVMRICSPIIEFPRMISDFDLERKTNVVIESNIILQPLKTQYAFISNISRNANTFKVDQHEFQNL